MKLSPGEVLWIARRQSRMTVPEMAIMMGMKEEEYRAVEKDRAPVNAVQSGPTLIHYEDADTFVKMEPLTAGETCALARRRKGWTLPQLGALIYRSRVALINAEHDRVDTSYLANCWVLIGWPSPSRKARLTLPLGAWADNLLSVPK
jgi:hypothetical protein